MLEMIYAIPEEIGWTLVGVVGTLCLIMVCKIVALFIRARKECCEEE